MKSFFKKNYYLLILILLIFGILIILINLFDYHANKIKFKDQTSYKTFQTLIKLPDIVKSSLMIFSGKRSFNNLLNDYNVKFLPKTEKLKLYSSKIKTSFDKSKSTTFFLETYEDKIIVVSKFGEFYLYNIKNFTKNNIKKTERKITIKNLNNNNSPIIINDILIVDNKIYVLSVNKNDGCNKLRIHQSNINEYFNFNLFKEFNECVGFGLVAGGMQEFYYQKKRGILLSTASSDNNPSTSKAQKDDSILGKILHVNSANKEVIIISKGHRNPQGLAVKGNLILSTEHGPKGGDEINKIIFGNNYGWPISSYGKPYKNEKNLNFEQNHLNKGFKEPLYVFLTAIGISELIFLPNEFHPEWMDNVIVTSLNGRSLFRIKFKNQSYENVLFTEKIFIGERIRDIKYLNKYKMIILALEDTGVINILSLEEIN